MKKHFVTFYSPGTFVAETTEKEISTWDVEQAKEMAQAISERYDAKPYGFRFTTRGRNENELDSKVIKTSPMYFLGGKIETLDEIKARNQKDEQILIANMESNHWEKVLINTNSYKWTQPLGKEDIVLEWP